MAPFPLKGTPVLEPLLVVVDVGGDEGEVDPD